jgi:hypothetical protein
VMRVSIYSSDPGFQNWEHGRRQYEVRCNGQIVPYAFTADDREGYVLSADLDENGKPRLHGWPEEIATRELYGMVEIREIT